MNYFRAEFFDVYMSYHNNILLDKLHGVPTDRPPVWVMRQAGRILPGYRQIRKSVSGFKELVKSPDLIAEVTLEPLHELGVDAPILFSDILVIPEAMGVDYDIIEKQGPKFPNPITSPADIDRLVYGEDVLDRLDYVFESITKTKARLSGSNPLIGFAGAPWTLFAYMIEGSGSKTFAKARRFLYEHPKDSHRLMSRISSATTAYVKQKIASGADVIQLFDSWSGMLSRAQYQEFCLPYISAIMEAIEGTPRIFFPKGAWSSIPDFGDVPMEAIGVDWRTPASYVREHLGEDLVIQGNMDPAFLYSDPDAIQSEVARISKDMGNQHIFNLGHGVYPDTDANHVKAMVQAVKSLG
ncbi:MAG: uroporphyrinogen decarboxylase [Bacteroidota bacterium]